MTTMANSAVVIIRPSSRSESLGRADEILHYAVVRDVGVGCDGCSLGVESATKKKWRLEIGCTPDKDAVDELRRAGLHPLAVSLKLDQAGSPECSALFSSEKGPRRLSISLGAAIALRVEGFHMIVTRN